MFHEQNIRQMKKAISIIRICILFTVGCIAILFIFGEEQNESILGFIFHFVIDKLVGIVLLVLTFMLYEHWSRHDRWIHHAAHWLDEIVCDEEKPQPITKEECK